MKRTSRSRSINDALLRRWSLPALDEEQGKESRGNVLVVGGSRQVPGAALLAAIGALRAGAGKLQIATVDSVAIPIAIAVPEAAVVALPETRSGEIARGAHRTLKKALASCDALVMGPGMMDARALVDVLEAFLATNDRGLAVLDAGSLDVLDDATYTHARTSATVRLLITPHPGEMAKLCGIDKDEVMARAEELAVETASKRGVAVALKGAQTFIASPDGELYCNTAGTLGLGTSGSGDTLAGIIGGLCARGATAMQALAWGVYLHAMAGKKLGRDVGPLGFLAREVLQEIPPLLGALEGHPRRR